jgi:Flp pilus assembly pilin Flp
MSFYFRFLREENGATSIEYSVCLSLIIVACIGAVTVFGAKANDLWNANLSKIDAATTSH